jgi:uncharacterized protein YkwD/DNA-directed RNA polymerase subunit RPC12/RpoP
MKHCISRFLSALMAALMTLSLLPTLALAADNTAGTTDAAVYTDDSSALAVVTLNNSSTIDTVLVSGTYWQDEARKLLDMVNEFRTGDDAWYWNSDNTTKTKVENLSKLTYDYQLEKVAMQRAIEIALSFSHTRPNGESCWTAYDDYGYSYYAAGENIAAGYGSAYNSAQDVFNGWAEENENYSGQGHRRNMLSKNYSRMGCAGVKYNGVYYWVQEFSGSNQTITPTTANNSLTEMEVEILRSNITSIKLNAGSTALTVEEGSSVSLPSVSTLITCSSTWPKKASCEVTPQGSWTSSNSSVAAISNSVVKGVRYGSTEVVYSALGSSVSVEVTVNCAHSYTSSVTKKPTCTATGVRTYTCSKCKDTYTEQIAKLDHSYQSVVTAPTCTQKGYTTYTCSVCGTSYTSNEVSATGHSYTSSVTKKPTCTATGVRTYTCSKCKNTYTEQIAKLNHSYQSVVTVPTCTKKGYTTYTCSVCGTSYTSNEVSATGHSYTSSVTKKPTCTETGVKTYTCSKCGGSYTESISALGHDYQTVVTKPTETTGGYTTHTCSRCGDTYRDNETAPLASKVEKKTNKLTVKNQTTLTASTSKAQTLTLNVESLSGNKVTYSNFKSNGSVKATCKDGKITFPKNFVGKVTVTAKTAASDNYLAASKTITITVNPTSTKLSSVSNAKGKKMTVKWKKNSLCSGYRIQYSTSKSFSSSKTKTVSKQSTTSTQISGLTKNKTYYVRIQTYKTVSGKNYYSGWSSASKVKISK